MKIEGGNANCTTIYLQKKKKGGKCKTVHSFNNRRGKKEANAESHTNTEMDRRPNTKCLLPLDVHVWMRKDWAPINQRVY